jgi:hypothetical protein
MKDDSDDSTSDDDTGKKKKKKQSTTSRKDSQRQQKAMMAGAAGGARKKSVEERMSEILKRHGSATSIDMLTVCTYVLACVCPCLCFVDRALCSSVHFSWRMYYWDRVGTRDKWRVTYILSARSIEK